MMRFISGCSLLLFFLRSADSFLALDASRRVAVGLTRQRRGDGPLSMIFDDQRRQLENFLTQKKEQLDGILLSDWIKSPRAEAKNWAELETALETSEAIDRGTARHGKDGIYQILTEEQFHNFMAANANRLVILKFTTSYCQACKKLDQNFRQLQEDPRFNSDLLEDPMVVIGNVHVSHNRYGTLYDPFGDFVTFQLGVVTVPQVRFYANAKKINTLVSDRAKGFSWNDMKHQIVDFVEEYAAEVQVGKPLEIWVETPTVSSVAENQPRVTVVEEPVALFDEQQPAGANVESHGGYEGLIERKSEVQDGGSTPPYVEDQPVANNIFEDKEEKFKDNLTIDIPHYSKPNLHQGAEQRTQSYENIFSNSVMHIGGGRAEDPNKMMGLGIGASSAKSLDSTELNLKNDAKASPSAPVPNMKIGAAKKPQSYENIFSNSVRHGTPVAYGPANDQENSYSDTHLMDGDGIVAPTSLEKEPAELSFDSKKSMMEESLTQAISDIQRLLEKETEVEVRDGEKQRSTVNKENHVGLSLEEYKDPRGLAAIPVDDSGDINSLLEQEEEELELNKPDNMIKNTASKFMDGAYMNSLLGQEKNEEQFFEENEGALSEIFDALDTDALVLEEGKGEDVVTDKNAVEASSATQNVDARVAVYLPEKKDDENFQTGETMVEGTATKTTNAVDIEQVLLHVEKQHDDNEVDQTIMEVTAAKTINVDDVKEMIEEEINTTVLDEDRKNAFTDVKPIKGERRHQPTMDIVDFVKDFAHQVERENKEGDEMAHRSIDAKQNSPVSTLLKAVIKKVDEAQTWVGSATEKVSKKTEETEPVPKWMDKIFNGDMHLKSFRRKLPWE